MGIKLREAFGDNIDFWIFEKNEDVGGTWFENRYPGKSYKFSRFGLTLIRQRLRL